MDCLTAKLQPQNEMLANKSFCHLLYMGREVGEGGIFQNTCEIPLRHVCPNSQLSLTLEWKLMCIILP